MAQTVPVASGRPFTHLAVDLQDGAVCRAAFSGLRDVNHVVDTAAYEEPGLIAGWSEQGQRQANPAMLRNLLAPLAADDALEHVSLLQGCQAAAPHALPARELSPIVGATPRSVRRRVCPSASRAGRTPTSARSLARPRRRHPHPRVLPPAT